MATASLLAHGVEAAFWQTVMSDIWLERKELVRISQQIDDMEVEGVSTLPVVLITTNIQV